VRNGGVGWEVVASAGVGPGHGLVEVVGAGVGEDGQGVGGCDGFEVVAVGEGDESGAGGGVEPGEQGG
jgi:hypothetical protein